MRVKLKYALPLVQMGLAAVLAWCHHLWLLAIMSSGSDSPGSSPSLRLLHSLNWPVLLVPKYRSMPFPLDAVSVVAVAGLLWYWVALNLDEFSQRRRVVMFERVPLRIGGDLLMIVSGACFGLACVATVDQGPAYDYPHIGSKWLWFLPALAVQFAWCVALIALFGRDVIKIPKFRDFMSNH